MESATGHFIGRQIVYLLVDLEVFKLDVLWWYAETKFGFPSVDGMLSDQVGMRRRWMVEIENVVKQEGGRR